MTIWSWTDGRGQTSAACVRAVHMRELVDLDQGAVGNPSSGRWPGRRLVGLVGFGGLWTANRARKKLAQRPERRWRPVRSGGTNRREWGHIRAELGAQPAGGWWVWWVSGVCFVPNARGEIPLGRWHDCSGLGAQTGAAGGISVPNWGTTGHRMVGFGGCQETVLARWRAENRPVTALCHGASPLGWGHKRNVPPFLKNVPPNVPPIFSDGGGLAWTGADS